MKHAAFIQKFGQYFVEATQGTPFFPSVKAAQAILETGGGLHFVGNNLFGIKANGKKSKFWNGDAINATTNEVINGNTETLSQAFRAYKSPVDSIKDHSEFLKQNPRYKNVFGAASPEAQAAALQSAGYATDPVYAGKLITIIQDNNLKELDKKKRV